MTNKKPMYITPRTFRDYDMYREECARARGWNEAMDMMFPKEAEERRKKKHPFYKQIKEAHDEH